MLVASLFICMKKLFVDGSGTWKKQRSMASDGEESDGGDHTSRSLLPPRGKTGVSLIGSPNQQNSTSCLFRRSRAPVPEWASLAGPRPTEVGETSDPSESELNHQLPTPFLVASRPLTSDVVWAKPAFRNGEPTREEGMWSSLNPTGSRLQGWDYDDINRQYLFSFAFFKPVCDSCEIVVARFVICELQERRRNPSHLATRDSEQVMMEKLWCTRPSYVGSCKRPAYLAALHSGRSREYAEGLVCCKRPGGDRCFALEVLAQLAQRENWTLRRAPSAPVDYLDCLRIYLNEHFCTLVEQGNVLQCFQGQMGRAGWACFHTSLLKSKTSEEIFCVLQRDFETAILCEDMSDHSSGHSWHYYCFVTVPELEEMSRPWNMVEPIRYLPDKANFIHPIYLRELTCFPSIALRKNIFTSHAYLAADVTWKVLALFPELPQSCRTVARALARAIKMLKFNPFLAVPYQDDIAKAAGTVRLLLPLKMDPHTSTTHMAVTLLISRESTLFVRDYEALTMIALPEAYACARVLMPVRQTWLSSSAFTVYDL